jgi:hypothetical protein
LGAYTSTRTVNRLNRLNRVTEVKMVGIASENPFDVLNDVEGVSAMAAKRAKKKAAVAAAAVVAATAALELNPSGLTDTELDEAKIEAYLVKRAAGACAASAVETESRLCVQQVSKTVGVTALER